MKWLSTTADEHVLCDDKGAPTEYRVRRDPVTALYIARDGERRIMMRLALAPCQRACEELYAAERGVNAAQRDKIRQPKRGRYSKPKDAA